MIAAKQVPWNLTTVARCTSITTNTKCKLCIWPSVYIPNDLPQEMVVLSSWAEV